MATNIMFRSLIRPQTIARMQAIGYLKHQPMHFRLCSTNSKLEQAGMQMKKKGSADADRLSDGIFEHDKCLKKLGKEFEDNVTTKAHSNPRTQLETCFARIDASCAQIDASCAQIDTSCAQIRTSLARLEDISKTGFNKIDRSLSDTHWYFVMIYSVMLSFFYWFSTHIERVADDTLETVKRISSDLSRLKK